VSLYSLSIRRPVLAIVMSLAILLFGFLGFRNLGVREFPSVEAPLITVVTNYRGASAEVIETQITEPLIYVDGVRIYNAPIGTGSASRVSISPLQDISAEDIDRIEVIKGASATTMYGTEASGGVIQIFTKRGISGDPIWNAELGLGYNVQGHVGPDSDPTQLYTECGNLDELYGLRDRTRGSDKIGERVYMFDPPVSQISYRWRRKYIQYFQHDCGDS